MTLLAITNPKTHASRSQLVPFPPNPRYPPPLIQSFEDLDFDDEQDKENCFKMLWKMIRVDPKERSSAEELLKEAWLQDDENKELVNTLQPNEGAIKQPSHMSASPARWSTPFQSDLPTPPPSSAANPPMELDMGNELVHSSIPPRSSGCNLVEPAVGLQTKPPLSPEKISQNDQKIEEGQNFLRRIQEPEKKLDQRRHEQELRLLTKQNDTILGELGQEKQKFQDLEQGLKALDAIFVKKNKKN